MSNKVLVTGASGFIGCHLCRHLLDLGFEVQATGWWRRHSREFRELLPLLSYVCADVLDPTAMRAVIRKCQPTAVFHLAGESLIVTAAANPISTYRLNVLGTVNLLEQTASCIEEGMPPPKLIQLSSSSDVYGNVSADLQPITERVAAWPDTAYGASKMAMEMVGLHYRRQYDLPIISTRLFTCGGPGQTSDVLLGFLARSFAEVRLAWRSEIKMGRLDNRRSFIDVRDVARGYCSLIEVEGRALPFFVNLTGAEQYNIEELIAILTEISGVHCPVILDPDLIRKRDKLLQIGDGTSFHALTSFKQAIPIKQTLKDMYQEWLERLT